MAAEDAGSSDLLLGIDLGAANVKVVLCDHRLQSLCSACVPGRGNPLEALLRELVGLTAWFDRPVRVACTGIARIRKTEIPRVNGINEILATCGGVRLDYPKARTVIDLGGQFSKWVLLGDDGQNAAVIDFASNGDCAAGGGVFLEQQAGRLKLSVEELGRMAAGAPRGANIAGRCSVFAKSDMIHLQQTGTPIDGIAFGLCQAMARAFAFGIMRNRKALPPVVLAGGGALNPGLVRAFVDVLGLGAEQILVPRDPLYCGARGAAMLAADAEPMRLQTFVEAVRECVRSSRASQSHHHRALAALSGLDPPRQSQPPEDPEAVSGDVGAFLGVDVGSVSTNLVLLGRDLEVLQGIYLATKGRPVEALNEGLEQIRRRFGSRLEILGVGTTGSGRHLAAKILGADIVKNEITAQMVSCRFYVPEADTIFEIGGQDSKYIFMRDGNLADFEMNKICSGGTGSFLEEQAERLAVNICGEFAELAFRAAQPCDLGSRCTVFMDSELTCAEERGATLDEVCAGLAYSIARNYLEKVVAGRPIGQNVVFQGGTASNAAVVAALSRLLGRPVRVHPYNRISGALGAALLAARAAPGATRFRGLHSCAAATVRSFECRQCENRCRVNRVQTSDRTVHFGDVCERYSERDHEESRLCRPFPELFAARRALMDQFATARDDEVAGKAKFGILSASLNLEFLPLWTCFLRALGYNPVISGRTTAALLQDHSCGVPAEMCLPVRIAAAHAKAQLADGKVDCVFVPAILECPHRCKDNPSHTCFYVQQLPDILRAELDGHVVAAQFALTGGILNLVEPVQALAECLNRSVEAVLRALVRAQTHYSRFRAARSSLGRDAMRASFDRAVVVMGRPYNVHDPFLNLHLARHLDKLGLPAVPWDLLPLEEVRLDPRWATVPWHYSRDQLRTLEFMRGDPRLFPVLVSNYGCGPDAFAVKHLEELLTGRPRLLLEFDEHRGEAGLVTRLEAFADEIDEHLRRRGPDMHRSKTTPGPSSLPSGRRFFIPNIAEHSRIYAAVLRSSGFESEVLPTPGEDTICLGEALSSGRECHPYAIIAGGLVEKVRNSSLRPGDTFLIPNCTSPCLLQQYGDGFRILLERLRLADLQICEATLAQLGQIVGIPGLLRLYEGLLAVDILFVLSSRLRAYEASAGSLDRQFEAAAAEVARAAEDKARIDPVLSQAASSMLRTPRKKIEGKLPVVGITGDLYTRVSAAGNAGLFRRLEELGCEVWPSPFFANMADLAYTMDMQRHVVRGRIPSAARNGMSRAVLASIRGRLVRSLPPEASSLALEPSIASLLRMVRPYVGPRTNYLILLSAAKIVDFLRRGAHGVINAAGINCIVGTTTASLIPAIRSDFKQAPVVSLVYGGRESAAERIRLETFVYQARAQVRSAAA